MMPVPELQPELWEIVISYGLRRSPPPSALSPWSELHQHDLTVVSRLNSTFQALAAPYLYTDVAVESFPSLIRGFAAPQIRKDPSSSTRPPGVVRTQRPSARPHILTKQELLCYTQTLHIAHDGPKCEVKFELEEGGTEWRPNTDNVASVLARFAEEAHDILSELWRALGPLMRAGDNIPSIMPNLDSVVIGRRDACGWDHFFEHAHSDVIDLCSKVQLAFTNVLMACRPRIICDHIDFGPYKLRTIEIPPDLTNLEYTVHLHQPPSGMALFMGASHRILAEPGINFFRRDEETEGPSSYIDEDFDYAFFACHLPSALEHLSHTSGKNAKRRIKDTKIAIYGLCRRERKEEEKIVEEYLFEDHLRAVDRQNRQYIEQFNKVQTLKRQEMDIINRIERQIIPAYPKRWGEVITMHPWWATYVCEACEWWSLVSDIDALIRFDEVAQKNARKEKKRK